MSHSIELKAKKFETYTIKEKTVRTGFALGGSAWMRPMLDEDDVLKVES
jgi:hypothetical protein